MKRAITSILLSLPISAAYADQTFYLNQGESISSLLYDRLKINPIYRSGVLNKVLEHNKISHEISKKLPTGTPINVPEAFLTSPAVETPTTEVSPEVEPSTSSEATAEDLPLTKVQTTLNKWFSLGLGPTLISGDGEDSDTSFSLLILKPTAKVGISFQANQHLFEGRLGADYTRMAEDEARVGASSFFLGKTLLSYRWVHQDFSFGPAVTYGQRMIFESKPDKQYEIFSPWLLGYGPKVTWKRLSFSYLLYPEQKVSSGLETKNNKELIFEYDSVHGGQGWRFEGSYFDNSTEDIKGQQLELGINYLWSF